MTSFTGTLCKAAVIGTAATVVAGLTASASLARADKPVACPTISLTSKAFTRTQVSSQPPSSSTSSSSAFPGTQLTCRYSGTEGLTITFFLVTGPAAALRIEKSFAHEHPPAPGFGGIPAFTGSGTNIVSTFTGGKSTTK